MDNLHLFALINAGPGFDSMRLGIAIAFAQWFIYLVPLAMVIAWIRGDYTARCDLLQLLLAVLIALAGAQVVMHLWPQSRPFALHLGNQYLAHANDPGFPSDHVTVIWSLALAALGTRRYAVWCFPLLAFGLVVGWSRVYLGVHFPYDVLAAFPIAALGALAAWLLREVMAPVFAAIVHTYDRLQKLAVGRFRATGKARGRKT